MKEKRGRGSLIKIKQRLPKLFGVEGFNPTAKMIEFAYAYRRMYEEAGVSDKFEVLSAPALCEKGLGFSHSLYFQWTKKPGFQQWVNEVMNDWFGVAGMRNVWGASYRRALLNSPQDTKLLAERFDKDYKPTTATEHLVSGLRPPDEAEEQAAIEASRKRIKSITKGENNEV